MFNCKICNKEFATNRALRGHLSSHSRGEYYRESRKTEKSILRNSVKEPRDKITKIKEVQIKIFKCKFCEKILDKGNQVGIHTVHCHLNPKSKMTKEKIRNSSIGRKHSDATKKKLSDIAKQNILNGRGYCSLSKDRIHEYNGNKFHGKWELKYAMYLDENNIKWERVKQNFPYTFENDVHRYTPDFYLTDSDVYVEVKGYEIEKDRCKWRDFPHTLKVLKHKELKNLGIKL